MPVFNAEFVDRRMREHRDMQRRTAQRLEDQIREEVLSDAQKSGSQISDAAERSRIRPVCRGN